MEEKGGITTPSGGKREEQGGKFSVFENRNKLIINKLTSKTHFLSKK